MTKIARLQVDIPETQLEELENLRDIGGLKTKRELWDTAFTLLKWAVKKKYRGISIGAMDPNGLFTELEMPFLETCASAAKLKDRATSKDDDDDTSLKTSKKAKKKVEVEMSSVLRDKAQARNNNKQA